MRVDERRRCAVVTLQLDHCVAAMDRPSREGGRHACAQRCTVQSTAQAAERKPCSMHAHCIGRHAARDTCACESGDTAFHAATPPPPRQRSVRRLPPPPPPPPSPAHPPDRSPVVSGSAKRRSGLFSQSADQVAGWEKYGASRSRATKRARACAGVRTAKAVHRPGAAEACAFVKARPCPSASTRGGPFPSACGRPFSSLSAPTRLAHERIYVQT